MFDFLYGADDAINLIKTDHDKVKELFDQFASARTVLEKTRIAARTIEELKLHAAIEEEIFYAAVRPKIEKKIMNEADEEHHVVKLLIAELEEMEGTEDNYDAKYKVLSENVRHHIKEEESDMLAKARALAIDYNVLGERIIARKEELKRTGVATFAEEKMVAASRGKGDSPAKAAQSGGHRSNAKALKSSAKRQVSKIITFKKPVKSALNKKPTATKLAKALHARKSVSKGKGRATSNHRTVRS